MKWIEALRLWNAEHNKGKWCVPRRGTPEHAEVRKLMGDEGTKAGKKAMKEARGIKEAAEEMKAVPKKRKIEIADEEEIDYDKMFREERLKEIGEKSKKAKIKAFLKKAIEKQKAKKLKEKEDVPWMILVPIGKSRVLKPNEYRSFITHNLQEKTDEEKEEIIKDMKKRFPNGALASKHAAEGRPYGVVRITKPPS